MARRWKTYFKKVLATIAEIENPVKYTIAHINAKIELNWVQQEI